jgi:arsenate reductase
LKPSKQPFITVRTSSTQVLAHPLPISRPIVITPWGVKLCRPSELVLDILPLPQRGPFAKEDGEMLIDAHGRRVVESKGGH